MSFKAKATGLTRTLLISLPWADYKGPSLQIGSLAAYAQRHGFEVNALHSHLEFAALIGFEEYDNYSLKEYRSSGDTLFAALKFPSASRPLAAYADRLMKGSSRLIGKIGRAMERIYSGIPWERYAVVGFTVTFDQLFSSLLMASWVKRDHPDIRILFGGRAIAGEMGRSVLRLFPEVDWCIDGEGELALVELLSNIRGQVSGFEKSVPNLVYRDGDRIAANAKGQLDDLRNLPDPDFSHYFSLMDVHPALRDTEILNFLPIEASRGCSHRCAFCCECLFWGGHRARPAKEAAAAIKRSCERYRTNAVYIVAPLMTNRNISELFPLLARHGIDYRLFCEFRADTTKENLIAMKRAGVTEVQIGLEALDSSLLKKMNKGTREIDNIAVMKFCEELGIRHVSNLMLGFPTETQREIDRTVKSIDDRACSFMPPQAMAPFLIREGSPAYIHPDRYGIKAIDERASYGAFLPKDVRASINLWYKDFSTGRKPRNYSKLKRRWEKWKSDYERSRASGRPLLHYFDCGEFIRIEDFRLGTRSITIEGWRRELYLFCDRIRHTSEIEAHFRETGSAELRRTLNELVRLKVMMREGQDWLALAIRSGPETRRHLPIL